MSAEHQGDLTTVVRSLRSRIGRARQRGETVGEQDTKRVFVTPLLDALGWDVVDLEEVVTRFKAGLSTDVSDQMPSEAYMKLMTSIDGLSRAVAKLDTGENPAVIASGIEFIFEGLHLNKRLNKDKVGRKSQYRG